MSLELSGGIVEVELVEHAVLIVVGKSSPVFLAELLSLFEETSEICFCGDLLSAK